jgi:hypothetical protein
VGCYNQAVNGTDIIPGVEEMDLLKTVLNAAGSGDLEKLGSQFGLDSGAVTKVLGQVVPALGRGLQKNASSANGLEGLLGALQKGGHQRYLENVEAAAAPAGIQEGNGILGHILGSKDVSRNVAAHASSASGVGADVIKKMLPMVATMAMGALSKETNGGRQAAAGGKKGSILGSLLDSDNDGSALDDVLDLAKRFF